MASFNQNRNNKFMKKIFSKMAMDVEDGKKPIKVYARVRPLNDEEVERDEQLSVETFDDEKRIKILDKKHSQETTYYFDGVFAGSDPNEKVYQHTTKHLLNKLLNGMNCALLTYGQTGSGKTYTLMADGCITEFAILELFRKIEADKLHKYKITCSFVQVYLEKVFDLLNPQKKEDLPVREHPKKGVYVADLSQHTARNADEVFRLLNRGKLELITAETKMVRQSSRSHSIFQLCIERRRETNIKMMSQFTTSHSTPTVHDNEPGEDPLTVLDEDVVLCSKMDICDLAGSERLGKTMVEGINRSEARYINSSLLQLGNVIYALSEGKRRHVPFRNSVLTRLLQQCLGSKCQTSFIVCVAPSSSEAYETRCSLNFGTRARTITNKERMNLNVEIDYKLLAKKLTKKIELLESELVEARPIRDFITSSLSNLNLVTSETQTDALDDSNIQINEKNCSIEDISHLTTCCEAIELLLETTENFSQSNQWNTDQLMLKTVETFLNNSRDALSTITQNLEKNEDTQNDEICSLVETCISKIDSMKNDVISVNSVDQNDFYAESSYCLSEACAEVELLMKEVINNFSNQIGENDVASLTSFEIIRKMTTTKVIIEQTGFIKILSTLEILLKILQLLQIPRLLFEQPNFVYEVSNTSSINTFCSRGTIDTISDAETVIDTSTEESIVSEFSSTMESKRKNFNNDEIQLLENENSGRMYPPLKVKLNRNHSFKYCAESKEVSKIKPSHRISRYIKRKRRVQSLEYPRTKTKRFVYIDDGSTSQSLCEDSFQVENHQLKNELVEMEKRFEEISNKYKQCVVEKEEINEKLLTTQQERLNLKGQKDLLEKEIEKQKLKNLEFHELNNKVNKESNSCEDEQFTDRNEAITHLEKILKEKENQIMRLEDENQRLKYDNDVIKRENKSAIDELISARQSLEKHEDKNKIQSELNISFAEDISRICCVLESVKQEHIKKSSTVVEDIVSLESELYNMIEGFVRYEDALTEIQSKANQVIDGKSKDQIEILEDLIPIKSNKKMIGPKIVTTRSPSHIAKRVNNTKKNYKRQIECLKREFTEQSVSAVKEIKSCRASRIKDLVQEKILMNERISSLEKVLLEKENSLNESKKHIDLLVQELGRVDTELNKQRSFIQFSRQNTFIKSDENSKSLKYDYDDSTHNVSEIPELDDTFISEIQGESSQKFSEDEKIKVLETNEKLTEELNHANEKCLRLERQLTSASIKREESHNISQDKYLLQRKIDYLTEANNALSEEIQTIKSTSRDRKFKLQESRERNNNLIEELEVYKRQISQMQARFDTNRIKLEKRISKMKEKIVSLETDNKRLENELVTIRCKIANGKSFNDDSGLQQDESEYEQY